MYIDKTKIPDGIGDFGFWELMAPNTGRGTRKYIEVGWDNKYT